MGLATDFTTALIPTPLKRAPAVLNSVIAPITSMFTFFLSSGTLSEALVRSMSSNKQSAIKVDKSLLSQLRRETGFGFAKCKESLQLNSNDFKAAVAWLEAEAEKQGWEKATKLQERAVSEGLVGVLVDGNNAAMVEVVISFNRLLCKNKKLILLSSVMSVKKHISDLQMEGLCHILVWSNC